MSTKHTQGPYRLYKPGLKISSIYVLSPDRTPRWSTIIAVVDASNPDAAANAQLFALSPKLFETLTLISTLHDNEADGATAKRLLRKASELARDAIAEAADVKEVA